MITNLNDTVSAEYAVVPAQRGLTKREYFALELMKVLLRRNNQPTDDAAYQAVRGAKHLVEQLNLGQ